MNAVAPFAGAWIEITIRPAQHSARTVAPFAGAWIEMALALSFDIETSSLRSPERGLKFIIFGSSFGKCMSLRSPERGLKLLILIHHFRSMLVAPFAGAWIEILSIHIFFV